jgi:hypothetical protein
MQMAADTMHNGPLSLTFVNVDDPLSIDRAQQRLVRSKATTASHRDPTRKRKAKKPRKRKKHDVISTPSSLQHVPVDNLVRTLVSAPDDTAGHNPPSISTESMLAQAQWSIGSAPRLEKGSSCLSRPSPLVQDSLQHSILHYYTQICLPPGMAILEEKPGEGQWLIEWTMREAFAEPAHFYIHLLHGCTPLVPRRPRTYRRRSMGEKSSRIQSQPGAP